MHRFHTAPERKGFTLTELAIVLGIIGTIIGGIWVASGEVISSRKVSKTTEQLLFITNKMRALYGPRGRMDLIKMEMTGDQTGDQLSLIQAGVFPVDALMNPIDADPNQVLDAWGGNIAVSWGRYTPPGGGATGYDGNAFVIAFDRLPIKDCVSFISNNTGNGRDAGLITTNVVAAGMPNAKTDFDAVPKYPFPLDIRVVRRQCTNAAKNSPDKLTSARLFFTLKQ